MQFERMTKEDIMNLSGFLLVQGACSFVIKKAEECFSKAGKQQMKIEMDVTDVDGKVASVYDYIFYSPAARWKIVSFCKAIDMESKLEEGSIEPYDLLNKRGQLVIMHEEYNGEKKNRVKNYLPHLEKALEQATKTDGFENSDLPF